VHTRGPWEREVHHYRNVRGDSYFYRDRELPSGPHDANAGGQLVLELNPAARLYGGRQSRFADRQSWTLEERLPYLFREIEERIRDAEHRAEDQRLAAEQAAQIAEREARERHRTWRALMEQAAERLLHEHRATELRNQASAWRQADQIRRYCHAAQAAHGDQPDTARWLHWAQAFADTLDPLTHPPTTPELSEVSPEDLQPYLPAGWSARGPDEGRRRDPHGRW
jgi:hypothetical protein